MINFNNAERYFKGQIKKYDVILYEKNRLIMKWSGLYKFSEWAATVMRPANNAQLTAATILVSVLLIFMNASTTTEEEPKRQ
jgi:S-ribosylhomocysteine lyase LuxS involved in autoinducer biosynthesis